MSVKKWQDKAGTQCWHISKQWPDGTRLRRKVPSKREGEKLEARIETAKLNGTWRNLRAELSGREEWTPTIEEFSVVYLREYCNVRNRRPDFKEQTLSTINRILGKIKVTDFTRANAYHFIEVRSREVQPATVNRGLAVLKNMLSYAIDKGLLDHHPMLKFRALPEKKKTRQLMTLEEERRLVECVWEINPVIGAYVAILGETGIRKSEGLNLQWRNVDLAKYVISLDYTKSGKVRHIPLSKFAVEAFISLPRASDCPYVFYNARMKQRWMHPREIFNRGKVIAGLPWVGIHDLRHFRASQWLMAKMDPRTVQELLGHSSMAMTQIYAHLAPEHASDHVKRIAATEEQNIQKLKQKWRQTGRL